MRPIVALILAAGVVTAAYLILKAAERGAQSADRAADEAARVREGISSSPLGKYILKPLALSGGDR